MIRLGTVPQITLYSELEAIDTKVIHYSAPLIGLYSHDGKQQPRQTT